MKQCPACGQRFQGPAWQCPGCRYMPEERDGILVFSNGQADGDAGYDPDFFSQMAEIEKGNFWFEARNRLISWALQRYFKGCRSFFEIGCGTGFVLSGLTRDCPRVALSAGDVFEEALDFAKRRNPTATLYQVDALELPFDDEFDVMGAFDVLEHVHADGDVIRQMYKAAKQGGGLLLTVPQHPGLWSSVDDISRHHRRYGRRELMDKVRRAGFHILFVTSFVSFLFPFLWVSRRMRSGSVDQGESMAEYALANPLNRLLLHISCAEQAFIRQGRSLPFGGSLLLVAKKI